MSLRLLILLCAVTHAIAADATPAPRTTRKLVATLDVRAADAPRYLCVISDLAGCSDAQRKSTPNSCPHPLASVLPARPGGPVELSPGPRLVTFDRPLPDAQLPPDLVAAWSQLSRNDDRSCAVGNGACRPELELPGRMFADPGFPPHVVCSNHNASGHEGDVAFLYLYFSRSSIDSGVSQIELQGTNATITFYSDINARDYVYAEVIGGAYASSARTLVGTQERLVVPLHPRCELYVAELPPHAGLSLPTATLETVGAGPVTCDAVGADSSSFQIRVPYSDKPHLTTLQVGNAASSFETSWTEALPPAPLRLAVRSLELTWRRDCMSGTWPSADTVPVDPRTEWSAACPRATVAAAGITCELRPADPPMSPRATPPTDSAVTADTEPELCRYRCQVPTGIAPFQLPTPIQFDRLRTHDGPQGSHVETVYSWNDTLHYVGEELRSFVPLPDRRVMVEIDPDEWVERKGEPLEEIRLLWPSGATGTIDLTRNRKWSRWRTMPAPGITCTDQVHVAVFGARAYEWRNFAAEGGQIVLPGPSEFLCPIGSCVIPFHFWVWAGIGILAPVNERTSDVSLIYIRPHSYGSLGSTLELYKNLGSVPSSLELDVSGDLGQTSFGTVQNQEKATTGFHDVWYSRLNAMVRYVWWAHPVWHYSLAAGAAVGYPSFGGDSNGIGTTWSFTLELGARFRLLHHSSQWFEAVGGARWGERHPFFDDFAHGETSSTRALLQFYLAGRFRFRLG